jgi:1-deoxy-D-xylulose-5-phosphate synthase
VLTAAMCEGNKLQKVRSVFPDRFFDTGICEGHAVAFAAGMAKAGMRPIVDIYSTFLQRSFDQIFQEVALQNLPVTFCLDRAGLTGPDGPTHHGAFDITYMRLFPNMVVMAPGDELDVAPMLHFALSHSGPASIRYPKAASWCFCVAQVVSLVRQSTRCRSPRSGARTPPAYPICVSTFQSPMFCPVGRIAGHRGRS